MKTNFINLSVLDRESRTAVLRVIPKVGFLSDLDLAILGEESTAYEAYVLQVRKEFRRYTQDEWIAGRAAFLRSLLGRERIFQTSQMAYREDNARFNMERELAWLCR